MNDYRRSLVEQAFRKLDNNGNGFIEFDDIKDIYNARKHPDVIQGKRTE
jgi:Ca2+-binding EF-hand superfamily protein